MTMLNSAAAREASEAIVQVTVPPAAFGAGFVQLNDGPLDCDSETNVPPPGRVSVRVKLGASSGPALPTSTANVTFEPTAAEAGADFVTNASDCPAATEAMNREDTATNITRRGRKDTGSPLSGSDLPKRDYSKFCH